MMADLTTGESLCMSYNRGTPFAQTMDTSKLETFPSENEASVNLLPPDVAVYPGTPETETDSRESEKEYRREKWSSKREYLLAAIGFCVGLGNLWRFPYLCQQNGGGAFLIPYLASLILCGLPLFFMEAALGQFSAQGAAQVWAFCPLLKGCGTAMNMVSVICFWYYNTIMAWALYYLVSSFQSVVPWSRCDGWWNTPSCFSFSTIQGHLSVNGNDSMGFNGTSLSDNLTLASSGVYIFPENSSLPGNVSLAGNGSLGAGLRQGRGVSAAEEFWQYNVLQVSGGLAQPGHVVWYLALTLLLTLVLIFFALVKGIRSTGKVVYVTATLPYILLTVLLVRGATLPGAKDGIIFYLKPDFSRLADPKVWSEAAVQVFYSLGPAWGGVITLASYNKFNNNCLRDSVLLTFLCEGTSIYGGFAIFAVLGYMAHQSGVPIDKVVSSGPGLAYIVYPEAISLMPLPQLWAVLFFIMLNTLAVDSQLTMAETFLTSLCDYFPRTLARRRTLVTALFCALAFPLSLPFVTQGGVYVFQLVDWYMASVTLFLVGLLECLVLAWVYGVPRFGYDIELMLGRRPPLIMTVLWRFITPACLLLLMVSTLMRYAPPTYGDYVYDGWGRFFGWTVAIVSLVPIPALAVHQVYKASGSLSQRIRHAVSPSDDWCPADEMQRPRYWKGVQEVKKQPRSGCCDVICRH